MATRQQASAQAGQLVQDKTKSYPLDPSVKQPVKTTVRDRSTPPSADDTALIVAERQDVSVTNVVAVVQILQDILRELQVISLYLKEGMNIRDDPNSLYVNSSST